jgi:hypothetical protein
MDSSVINKEGIEVIYFHGDSKDYLSKKTLRIGK